ncbi:MAG: hypothetical protein JO327_00510 [Nitrososphaeraceae archaeon]|nr:hypothetical protein [Nitrososphaeraceae archaeon]
MCIYGYVEEINLSPDIEAKILDIGFGDLTKTIGKFEIKNNCIKEWKSLWVSEGDKEKILGGIEPLASGKVCCKDRCIFKYF